MPGRKLQHYTFKVLDGIDLSGQKKTERTNYLVLRHKRQVLIAVPSDTSNGLLQEACTSDTDRKRVIDGNR